MYRCVLTVMYILPMTKNIPESLLYSTTYPDIAVASTDPHIQTRKCGADDDNEKDRSQIDSRGHKRTYIRLI